MNAQIAYADNGDVIPAWTFADRLRKARSIAGMDQRQFAAVLERKPSAYAQWEAGNNKPRDIVEIAKRIEMLTRIPATWILDIDGPSTPSPDAKKAPTVSGEGQGLLELDSNQQPIDLWSERSKRRGITEIVERETSATITQLRAV